MNDTNDKTSTTTTTTRNNINNGDVYTNTLILNYKNRQHSLQTKAIDKNTLYQTLLKSDLVQTSGVLTQKRKFEEENEEEKKELILSFFGNYPGMCGRLNCCDVDTLRNVIHPYLRDNYFSVCGLVGSLTIPRNNLHYQHFCLDIDLKMLQRCQSECVLNTEEYINYCREKRFKCAEYYCMSNKILDGATNTMDGATNIMNVDYTFKANYFVYELVYILTEYLGFKSFSIYILGKGGNINKGFHLEIPSLIMPYHDLALLYHTCHQIVPNTHILDPTRFYSAFGSCKYNKANSSILSTDTFTVDEFNCTYLPYCRFSQGEFQCEIPIYKTLVEAFDHFNIFKTLHSSTRIYSFKLFTQVLHSSNSSSSNKNVLFTSNVTSAEINALLNEDDRALFLVNDDSEDIIDDTSIPEWRYHDHNKQQQQKLDKDNNHSTKITKLTQVLLERVVVVSSTNNNDDSTEASPPLSVVEEKGYYVGSLMIENVIKIKLYKSLTSLDDTDYKTVCDSVFNYKKFHHSSSLKWQLRVNLIPDYSFTNNNDLRKSFTNIYMGSSDVLENIVFKINNSITDEREEDEKYLFGFSDQKDPQNFTFLGSSIYPFTTKHLLKLLGKVDDQRLNNTVFYLVSLHILASAKRKERNHFLGEWLHLLLHLRGENRKKNISEFLQMYNHLNIKLKNNIFELKSDFANWVILCLKHLMIIENVIDIEEAIYIMKLQNYDNNNNNNNNNDDNDDDKIIIDKFCNQSFVFSIPGATTNITIPNIICASMLISHNQITFYELLALYRPMLFNNGNANLLTLWDEMRWKSIQTNVLKSHLASHMPELYYISNIITHIYNYRKELKQSNKKKQQATSSLLPPPQQQQRRRNQWRQQPPPPPMPVVQPIPIVPPPPSAFIILSLDEIITSSDEQQLPSSSSSSTTIIHNSSPFSSYYHCTVSKNTHIILNEILNKIQAFWAGTELHVAPPTILKFIDCYIMLGMCQKNGKLIDMRPLPVYFTDDDSSVEVGGGGCSSSEMKGLSQGGEKEEEHNNNDPFYQMESLLTHMKTCPFLRQQLYPIIHNILDRTLCEQQHTHMENTNMGAEQRNIINNRSVAEGFSVGNFPNDYEDQILMDIQGCVAENNGNNIKCNIEIMTERRRLAIMSRYQHHLELTEKLWNEDTHALVKLVKYFVLKQMANSYTDMANIIKLCNPEEKKMLSNILNEYVQQTPSERKLALSKRIGVLATVLYKNLENHPYGARMPEDIPIKEMTPTACNCPVTYTLISLLQTFSYDVASLRYLLSVITMSICYGISLKNKRIHFLLGDTNSGKTFFLQCILASVKNLAGILSSHTAHHTSTLDRYHDLGKGAARARFWYMDEIANKPLNRQLLNQITGNSRLFIRSNYESGSNVRLAPTVLIFGNNKPSFNDNCPALMERLRFFTFRAQFNSNMPVNFKISCFPQLSLYHRYENVIKFGMSAILLHAACHTGDDSPLYLYDNLLYNMIEPTLNVRESTDIYSPVSDIVKAILGYCQLIEDPQSLVSHARVIYLITNLQALKRINVDCVSDAIRFLGDRYHTSLIDNNLLPFDDDHKDSSYSKTAVFHGLRENDVALNDERILKLKNKTHFF